MAYSGTVSPVDVSYPETGKAFSGMVCRVSGRMKSVTLMLSVNSPSRRAVTVYYNHDMPTEQVKDAINSGVFQALQKNGIEIPYNYVNVVTKKE